jgi:predicted CxxxxCH...CXXCH cytochrome family protein
MNVDRTALLAIAAALVTLAACGSARTGATGAAATTCTTCHGGKDNLSGAPPNDVRGNTATTELAVGHHTAHVEAGLACTICHPDRPSIQTPGHMDGRTDVALGGIAVAGGSVPAPQFDAQTGTCSNVYCHGTTLKTAGQRPDPVWTQPFSAGACAGCHGFPPTSVGHPLSTDCASCHPDTVGAGGLLRAGGKHLDGRVDAIQQHLAGYADAASHGPDAIAFLQGQLGVRDCRSCHGADLNGGIAPSCTSCHEAAGWVTPAWQANCTMCHGTKDKAFVYATSLAEAAPPEGVGGETSGPGVGAHQKHLTAGAVASGFACATCHAVPVQEAPLEHLDGSAAVAFTGIGAGTYDASAQTCATACHAPAGSPAWTSTAPLGCADCHGAPPATGGRHPGEEPGHDFAGTNCGICHGGVAGILPNLVDASRHVDGTKDVSLSIGTWDATAKTCATACHGTLEPFPWARP